MNDPGKKKVLNAGCGAAGGGRVASIFRPTLWHEVRLDIEPGTRPDIVGSFADMRGLVADGCFDALYSSHAIEHLYAHEVIPALREFLRVLKPDGFALVTCPDLAAIARQVLDGGAEGDRLSVAGRPDPRHRHALRPQRIHRRRRDRHGA